MAKGPSPRRAVCQDKEEIAPFVSKEGFAWIHARIDVRFETRDILEADASARTH